MHATTPSSFGSFLGGPGDSTRPVTLRQSVSHPDLSTERLAALPWRLTSIYGRVGGGPMPQRVRDGKNCRNVAASAATAVAPTVRKRPTAQVVSIDQAQSREVPKEAPSPRISQSKPTASHRHGHYSEPSCIAPADRKSSARYASIFGSVVNSRQWSGSTDGKTIR